MFTLILNGGAGVAQIDRRTHAFATIGTATQFTYGIVRIAIVALANAAGRVACGAQGIATHTAGGPMLTAKHVFAHTVTRRMLMAKMFFAGVTRMAAIGTVGRAARFTIADVDCGRTTTRTQRNAVGAIDAPVARSGMIKARPHFAPTVGARFETI